MRQMPKKLMENRPKAMRRSWKYFLRTSFFETTTFSQTIISGSTASLITGILYASLEHTLFNRLQKLILKPNIAEFLASSDLNVIYAF